MRWYERINKTVSFCLIWLMSIHSTYSCNFSFCTETDVDKKKLLAKAHMALNVNLVEK